MRNRTTDELSDLYHESIRLIDVDFGTGIATIHCTFTLTTTRINLAHEKAPARSQARASNKVSIDEPVGRASGQVVGHAGPSWNLLLAELRSLSIIVEKAETSTFLQDKPSLLVEGDSGRCAILAEKASTRTRCIRR